MRASRSAFRPRSSARVAQLCRRRSNTIFVTPFALKEDLMNHPSLARPRPRVRRLRTAARRSVAGRVRPERQGEVHRLCDQHEQRTEDGGPRFRDLPLVDRRRARAAAGDRERKQESDRQAPAGAAKDAEGRLHPHDAVARVGSALCEATPLDEGGRTIVLATDRPIGFWEARNQPRSIDYPFTILEMHLDKNDEGTGRFSRAPRSTSTRRATWCWRTTPSSR